MDGTASETKNEAGGTTLLDVLKSFDEWKQCFDGMGAGQVKAKLLEINFEQQFKLLNWQDEDGQTVLFTISEPAKLQMLLEVVPRNKRLKLLFKQDNNQRTFLHMDMPSKMLNIVSHVLRSSGAQQRMKLALLTDSNGETFLFNKSCNAVIKLLSAFHADDIFLLCTKKNLSGSTFLHLIEGVMPVIKLVPKNQQAQLLSLTDAENKRVFQISKEHIDSGTAKELYDALPAADKVTLIFDRISGGPLSEMLQSLADVPILDMLISENTSGCPAIHIMLSQNDVSEVLRVIRLFPSDQAYRLLTLTGNQRENTLTKICSSRSISAKDVSQLSAIFSSLTQSQRDSLIDIKGGDGKTIVHLLSKSLGFQNALPILGTLSPHKVTPILTMHTRWNKNHTSLFKKLHKSEKSTQIITTIFSFVPTYLWFDVVHDSLGKSESFKTLSDFLTNISEEQVTLFALGRKLDACTPDGEHIAQSFRTTINVAYDRKLYREIKLIIDLVPAMYRGSVLGERNSYGQNILHQTIVAQDYQTIDNILYWCEDESISALARPDIEGNTVLHMAAIQTDVPQALTTLKRLLHAFRVSNDPLSLILEQNNLGKSFLHLVIEAKTVPIISLHPIMQRCSTLNQKGELMPLESLMSLQDSQGNTALHLAAIKNHEEQLLTMIKSVELSVRHRILGLRNGRGNNVLNCAAFHRRLASLSAIIPLIEQPTLLPLLQSKNKQELSVVACALRFLNTPLWETLEKRLTAGDLYEIVREQDIDGRTLLHLTWIQKQYNIIHDLARKLDFDQLLEVSKVPDASNHTALGRAIVMVESGCGRLDQVLAFLQQFDCRDMTRLLKIPAIIKSISCNNTCSKTQYPMHMIKCADTFNKVIEKLEPADALDLSMCSVDGNTLLHHSTSLFQLIGQNPTEVLLQRLPYCREAEELVDKVNEDGVTAHAMAIHNKRETAAKAIEKWKTYASLVSISGQSIDQATDIQEVINKLMTDRVYNLGPEEIERLFPLSDNYILPWRQDRVKQAAMILYNTHERKGATDEAEKMELSLQAAGFSLVVKAEWKSVDDLLLLLHSHLTQNAKMLSLLTVCIMSHGKTGNLIDSNLGTIAISDVLDSIDQRIPKHIPLIAIIQACQIYNSANASTAASFMDASRGPREESTHITLRRKHSYLLLSSVIGGASVRGAYTGALAEQFQKADGKTDIFQMIKMAKLQMQKKHPECENQVPETRDTLMKNLVLPPKLRPSK